MGEITPRGKLYNSMTNNGQILSCVIFVVGLLLLMIYSVAVEVYMSKVSDETLEQVLDKIENGISSEKVLLDDETRAALDRLISVALSGTGQSKYVADLLLAWWCASDNGGFDPMSFRRLDDSLVADCLRILVWIGRNNVYPDSVGYGDEFRMIWKVWRSNKSTA